MRRPIVFVTDYGRDDTYAAALTGAAWRVDPRAICVEGTHGVPPGDVLAGAYYLKSLALAFERSVVFCAVIDPGVGSSRRAIAIDVGDMLCVAPDNGLVSYLWEEAATDARYAVQLDIPRGASATFHGRDVFAPTAAQLASGTDLGDAGTAIDDPVLLSGAFARSLGQELHGVVAIVDHFGNAVTTIRDVDIGDRPITRVRWDGGATDQVVSTYDEISEGLAALIGSAGHLEIAARGRRAPDSGGPALHDGVSLSFG